MERSPPSAQAPFLLETSQPSAPPSGGLLGEAPPLPAHPPAPASGFTFLTTAAPRAVGTLAAAAPKWTPPTPGKEVKSQNILGRCCSPPVHHRCVRKNVACREDWTSRRTAHALRGRYKKRKRRRGGGPRGEATAASRPARWWCSRRAQGLTEVSQRVRKRGGAVQGGEEGEGGGVTRTVGVGQRWSRVRCTTHPPTRPRRLREPVPGLCTGLTPCAPVFEPPRRGSIQRLVSVSGGRLCARGERARSGREGGRGWPPRRKYFCKPMSRGTRYETGENQRGESSKLLPSWLSGICSTQRAAASSVIPDSPGSAAGGPTERTCMRADAARGRQHSKSVRQVV